MVSATRWRQDRLLAPTNLNQRIRYYPTFPSGGGGYSAFGWSPEPIADALKVTAPAGVASGSGLSGIGAPLIPGISGIAKVLGALAGVAAGAWLAHRNLER
jgi:hypothetical protein